MVFKTIDRETGLQIVLDGIRSAILDNKFRPGSQLKQSVIATEFGVSQGLVREALAQLLVEGLVENSPYRGTFVCTLEEKDIKEIYQLRATLECLAMELTLPKFQDGMHLQDLEEIHQQTLVALRGNNPDLISTTDLEFHRFIVELSNNSRLIRAWNSIVAQSRYLLRNLYSVGINLKASDHSDWMDAIRNKADISVIHQIIKTRMFATENILLDNWYKVQSMASLKQV